MDSFMIEVEWDVPPNMPGLPRRVGPFKTNNEAVQWGELNISNGEWNVCQLAWPYLVTAS